MSSRILVVLALALAGLLGALYVSFGGTGAAALAGEPERPAARPTSAEVAPVSPVSAADTSAPTERRAATAAPAAPENRPRETAFVEDAEELVRVIVQLEYEEAANWDFTGYVVEAQSWIQATDEIFLHQLEVDARGRATIAFREDVHLDFVRCAPPEPSGLALAFVEDHIDLTPGEVYEQFLYLEEGSEVVGVVEDEAGRPVAGAEVHGFPDGVWGLEDWQPAVVRATSGDDGRFRFPPLSNGEWNFAVAPDDWLQLDPSIDDPPHYELTPGEDVDVGKLVVLPIERLWVDVVDEAGQPVPDASVVLSPSGFASSTLSVDAEVDDLDRFLGRGSVGAIEASARFSWEFGRLRFLADANGAVEIFGPAGEWSLSVWPQIAEGASDPTAVTRTISLPHREDRLVVQLPSTLLSVSGTTVDREGRPAPRVRLILDRRFDGDIERSGTRSDEAGSFSFGSLPPDGEYSVFVSGGDYLPSQWSVDVEPDAEPLELEVRRAGRVNLRLIDTEGKPVRAYARLLPASSTEELRECDRNWADKTGRRKRAPRSGILRWMQVPLGQVQVVISRPWPTGGFDARGRALTEVRESQTFVVDVLEADGTVTDLVLDVVPPPAPAPPPFPEHYGIVVDAVTGAPIPGANLWLWGKRGLERARTDASGTFRVRGLIGGHSFDIFADGYAGRVIASAEYEAIEHEHRFELDPGMRALELQIVDTHGEPLPSCDVNFFDANGGRVLCSVGDDRFSRHSDVTNGRLDITSAPLFDVSLALTIDGYEVGSVLLPAGFDGRSLYLDESLAEIRERIAAQQAAEEED